MTNPNKSVNIPIPADWTGNEAKAVVGFLEEICLAIWYIYEESVAEAYKREKMFNEGIDDDFEMPF